MYALMDSNTYSSIFIELQVMKLVCFLYIWFPVVFGSDRILASEATFPIKRFIQELIQL